MKRIEAGTKAGGKAEVRHPTGRYLGYALIFLVIVFLSFVRFRLRNMPLERDEGEYAYAGQLLLQGIPPYKLAYNMKLPGTYAAYAVIMTLLGQTPAGIRLGLLVINIATVLLVYLLGTKISGRTAGVVAAATYALLSLSPSVFGFAGHATHFVAFTAVAGILLLLIAMEGRRPLLFFLSGIFCGVAFVMKQPGFLFAVFGALYLVADRWRKNLDYLFLRKQLGPFLLGAAIPYGLACLILLRAHVFHAFWFWTVAYASQYATQISLRDGVLWFWNTFPKVVGPSLWLWVLGGIGLSAFIWDRTTRARKAFVLGFSLFSFLAVCPGLYFREHYFILMLPAVSLLVGIAVSALMRAVSSYSSSKVLLGLPMTLFALAMASAIYQQKDFFFRFGPAAAIRKAYDDNPFPEAIPIADYISRHSPPGACIAVLGSEPELYFYAHRRSATGYIYTYGLMEEQVYATQMQQQMIKEIETAQPEFIVIVEVPNSWLVRPDSQRLIFSWGRKYVADHYELTGIADIFSDTTEYRWDDAARAYQPSSGSTVYVFKKKTP